MKYFWNKAKGLKADVERHRAKEQELEATIAALEGSNDPVDHAELRVYRHMLHQLHLSKVEVVTKIGKK
jgi:hypothetical protein